LVVFGLYGYAKIGEQVVFFSLSSRPLYSAITDNVSKCVIPFGFFVALAFFSDFAIYVM